MSNTVQISFLNVVDRVAIEAETIYNIDVVENYVNNTTTVVDINAFDSTTKEAFKKVFDELTFAFNQDAYIFNIDLSVKTFDLSTSYKRTVKNTTGPLTAFTAGLPYELNFETPGFGTFYTKTISAWYDQNFLVDDLADLRDMGIVLTGNGKAFTISNTVQCRVSITKPSVVTDLYIINNVFSNTIIEL